MVKLVSGLFYGRSITASESQHRVADIVLSLEDKKSN